MENKTLAYLGLGIALLLLIGTFAMGAMSNMTWRSVGDMADNHGGEQPVSLSNSEELTKYRSEDIPEDCRLPEYENSVESWKEHLSHHKETLYCLDYFK